MSGFAGVRAWVFDAYGTLLDLGSAAARCPAVPEEKRAALSTLWREKQLQYTWLRSLQHRHADFAAVTEAALDYALEALGLSDPARHAALMALYRRLDPYPEVPDALAAIRARGLPTAVLSNGTPAMLAEAVAAAGIADRLDHLLSAEEAGVFKTDPRLYRLAVDRLGLRAAEIGFVSANGWDAWAGAAYGFRVVWCNRAGAPAERLPGRPAGVVRSLAALPALLAA